MAVFQTKNKEPIFIKKITTVKWIISNKALNLTLCSLFSARKNAVSCYKQSQTETKLTVAKQHFNTLLVIPRISSDGAYDWHMLTY